MEYEMIPHSHIHGLRILISEISYRSLHIHREFELIHVLDGTLQLVSSERTIIAPTGSVVVLGPWQTHELRSTQAEVTCLYVQVSPDLLRGYYPMAPRLRFLETQPADEAVGNQLAHILLQIASDYLNRRTAYEFACMKQVNACFELLLRTMPWQIQNEHDTERESVVSQRLARIIDHVQENYASKLLLEDIAQMENLTVDFLTHFIKKHFGMSFRSYLALVRFEHARKMLEHDALSLVEISRACGFSDLRYMEKVFMEQLGCTAKEYRRQFASDTGKKQTRRSTETERLLTDDEALRYLRRYMEERA